MKHSTLLIVSIVVASIVILLFPREGIIAEEEIELTGRIVNGTAGATVPDSQQLSVHVSKGQQEIALRTVTASADGMFRLPGVPWATDYDYLLVTEHAGVTYTSALTGAEAKQPVQLVIYELTSSQDKLGLGDSVLVVIGVDKGSRLLRAFERVTLVNKGDRTFFPDLSEPQRMNFVRFSLPSGARDLAVRSDLSGGNVINLDVGFALTAPVPPGTHEIGFAYAAPYENQSLSFTRTFHLGAEVFRVLLPEQFGEFSQNLSVQGKVTIGGVSYWLAEIRDLPPRAAVQVGFQKLPESSWWLRTWRTLDSGGYLTIAIVLLLVAGLLVLVVTALTRRRRSASEVNMPENANLAEIAGVIAELDDRFAAHELPEDEYNAHRQALKARLVRLLAAARSSGLQVSSPEKQMP